MTTEVMFRDRMDLAAVYNARDRIPLVCYLARLSVGSRRTMSQALRFIAEEFSGGHCNATTFPWEQLRYEHTQAIRAKLADRYAPATANKMLSALRGILLECWRLGTIGVEEMHRASDLPPVRGTRIPKGKALSQDMVRLLADHCTTPRDRALVFFLATTGLRRAEAAALRWDDFKPGPTVRVRGKGNKERDVPVPVWVANLLSGLRLGEQKPAGIYSVFGITTNRIWQVLREACWAAGMSMVTPHDLRRTYATRLLGSGADLATVQRLMGHSNPKTTAGYDRRTLDDARHAVEAAFA